MVNLDITQEQLEILFDLLPAIETIRITNNSNPDIVDAYIDLKHKIYSEVVKNENL